MIFILVQDELRKMVKIEVLPVLFKKIHFKGCNVIWQGWILTSATNNSNSTGQRYRCRKQCAVVCVLRLALDKVVKRRI